jgi:hypothetical protein
MALDGANIPQHGMFYMESAGGFHGRSEEPEEQHQPGCFALEEEKGEGWSGTGASRPLLNEAKPTL